MKLGVETVSFGSRQNKVIEYCPHLLHTLKKIYKNEEEVNNFMTSSVSLECYICEEKTQIFHCIQNDCMKTFCSLPKTNHALMHSTINPWHCIFTDLTTMKTWCFICKAQIHFENDEDIVPGSGGLENTGNSCYMNAVLLALCNIPHVACFFLKTYDFLLPLPNMKIETDLTPVFKNFMANLWSPESINCLTPDKVLSTVSNHYPVFRDNIQHDSNEFLRCLLELLHEEMKVPFNEGTVSTHKSIISDIFSGSLISAIKCLGCKKIYKNVEPFLILSLPIPMKSWEDIIVKNKIPPTQRWLYKEDQSWMSWLLQGLRSIFINPITTLHDCLASFFSLDYLTGENQLNCSGCQKMANGIKRFKLFTIPEVLCIHLKRFTYDTSGGGKVDDHVLFPFEGLDLRYYMKNDRPNYNSRYTLISVICHQGESTESGHFTCYSLNPRSNSWYHYDDKRVTFVERNEVKKVQAYMLIYRKECVSKRRFMERAKLLKTLSRFESKSYFISKEWFTKFCSFSEPGKIINKGRLCKHYKLINKEDFLRFTFPVWLHYRKTFGGGPELTVNSFCEICNSENTPSLN